MTPTECEEMEEIEFLVARLSLQNEAEIQPERPLGKVLEFKPRTAP